MSADDWNLILYITPALATITVCAFGLGAMFGVWLFELIITNHKIDREEKRREQSRNN